MAETLEERKRGLLAEYFLLRQLPDADLDRLSRMAKIRSFERGVPVFRKGDPATGMMVVITGRVRISSYSADGKEVVLNIINPGEVFGEIALIDGFDRTADATAMESSEMLVLERRDFMPYLEKHPAVSIHLLKVLCQRLRVTSEQLEDFSFLDLRRRMAKRLLYLADHHGEPTPEGMRIGMHLPQRELGAMLGTSREAVNKQLRAWEGQGLIGQVRGSITVIDRHGLEGIVDEHP